MIPRSAYRRLTRSLMVAGIAAAFARPVLALSPHWEPLCEPGNDGWSTSLEVSPHDAKRLVIGDDMFGTCVSTDGGSSWQTASGFKGYRTGDFTFDPRDPNTVWVGTQGGPYKSVDGGFTWTSRREGLPTWQTHTYTAPIQKIVFDPNRPKTLLAFGGCHRLSLSGPQASTVWKSVDGGEHWTRLATIAEAAEAAPIGTQSICITNAGFAAGSSSILFASSRQGGVFRSDDGGASWRAVNAGLPSHVANFIALHPTNPNVVWVCLGNHGGVYRSDNGGAEWRPSSAGMDAGPRENISTIVVATSNPKILYAGDVGYHITYRSADGGATWTPILDLQSTGKIIGGTAYYLPYAQNTTPWWVSVDPRNADRVYDLVPGYVVASTNGGATWTDITSHRVEGGWRGNGYQVECGFSVKWNPFRPLQLFAQAADAGKLVRSSDGGWSWTTGAAGMQIFNGGHDVTFACDGTIYVGTGQNGNPNNEAICKSRDWGATWAYLPRPAGARGDNEAVYVLPEDSRRLWAGIGAMLYRSEDGGMSWQKCDITDPGAIYNIAPDPHRPTTFTVGAKNGIFQTTDGAHFVLMAGSPRSGNSNRVYVDPAEPGVLWAVNFHSADGGVWRYSGSWRRVWRHEMAYALAIDPSDSRRLAVVTMDWPDGDVVRSDGVSLSLDGGATWATCNEGLKSLCGEVIAFNPDRSGQLIVGLDGGGFYVTDLGVSRPFRGKPHDVTHTIPATDYDLGGEFVAYHRSARASASGGLYRRDGVGIRRDGRGYALTDLRPADWVKYSVRVPLSGRYRLVMRCASASGGARLHLFMNGASVSGPVGIPSTGGISLWRDVVRQDVRLHAGEQFLRLYVETGGADLASIRLDLASSARRP